LFSTKDPLGDVGSSLEQACFRAPLLTNAHSLDTDLTDALMQHSRSVKVHIISASRPGKKLLVLDLDHTILDFESSPDCGIPFDRMKRPYLDEFLERVYKEYDICIWSQTRWQWVEIKLAQMGMLNHPGYRVCFCLDKGTLFKTALLGSIKPLAIIFNIFPGIWSRKNTLHVDDLERHFELNKDNGLLVNAFYRVGNESKRSQKTAREQFKQQERERELYGCSGGTVHSDSNAGALSATQQISLDKADASSSILSAQPPSADNGGCVASYIGAEADDELLLLSYYLTSDALIHCDDVTNCGLNHRSWREYARTIVEMSQGSRSQDSTTADSRGV
jgi:HAD-superfamily hydrolase (TIGR02245 family)